MDIQNACHLLVLLVAACSVPQTVAQSDRPSYCNTAINGCHDQTVPSGGIYVGFTGSDAQQRQQWTEFCFAVGMADTCLASVPGECLEAAAIDRIHHIGVCTLEYSDFIAVDECTDVAIIDSQYTSCNEAAQRTFELGLADACEYATDTLRCANQSFIRHCGQEWGALFGSMFTRASLVSFAQHLPANCHLLSIADWAIPTPPTPVTTCNNQVDGCSGGIPDLTTISSSQWQGFCSNFYRSGSCLSRVSAGGCENEVDAHNNLINFACTKSLSEIRDIDACHQSLNEDQCTIGASGSPCIRFTSYANCVELYIRRACASEVAGNAIDFWYAIIIGYIRPLVSQDCPLLDRIPDPISAAVVPTPWITTPVTAILLVFTLARIGKYI